jgi:hypothetical protein
MSLNMGRHEPLGIVIQDGGQAVAAPRIMMWYWASEADVPEWERE